MNSEGLKGQQGTRVGVGLLARWAVTPEKLGRSRFLKQLPSVCRQDTGDPGFSDVTRESCRAEESKGH